MTTFLRPPVAPRVEMFSVTCVGSTKVTELIATPLMLALKRLANPAPGSKKPDPALEVPIIVTLTDDRPAATEEGLMLASAAGGGAISLTARTPHAFVAVAYSWNVHI